MTTFDGRVRAAVYRMLIAGSRPVSAGDLAVEVGVEPEEVQSSLRRLADEHQLALTDEGAVRMAHPFSGVATEYRAVIADRWWYANCAWDALAVLALLGDGDAHGPEGLAWRVEGGAVTPDGVIHFQVPARHFWDDIGFT